MQQRFVNIDEIKSVILFLTLLILAPLKIKILRKKRRSQVLLARFQFNKPKSNMVSTLKLTGSIFSKKKLEIDADKHSFPG